MPLESTARAKGSPTLPPKTRIGQYEVLDRVAAGGMAELYLARRVGISGFEKRVALKRVLPALVHDAAFTQMFLDEARLAARLDHPNVVQVIDIGVVDDEFFFVMEYLHGKNLRSVMREVAKGKPLPLDFVVNIGIRMAAGLHHAHECRDSEGNLLHLVHRDVSPQNVIVTYDGHVKLVDFGIAKAAVSQTHTQTGTVKGKVGYMAPEQFKGKPIDRRVDLFALGIVLYELAVGRRPFRGDNQFAIMNAAIDGTYPRPLDVVPGFPVRLQEVIDRALLAEPDERFSTAEELQTALEEAALDLGIRVSPSVVRNFMRDNFKVPRLKTQPIDPETQEAANSLTSYRTGQVRASEELTTALTGSAPVARPRRLFAVAAGAIAVTLIAGVGLGVWLAGGHSDASYPARLPPDPSPTAPVAAPALVAEADEGEPVADKDAAADEDAVAGNDVVAAADPEPEEVIEVIEDSPPDDVVERNPAETKAKRRRKSSKKSKAPSLLFPPSHRD